MQQSENTIAYRMEAIEREVAGLKGQLERYVPVRENELQLKSIRDTVERIERDVQETKRQLGDVGSKLVASQAESERRDAEQSARRAAWQIRALVSILSTIIGGLIAILVAVITGFFK